MDTLHRTCDERVTPALKVEIEAVPRRAGCRCLRVAGPVDGARSRNVAFGLMADYQLRLFRKISCSFSLRRSAHEGVVTQRPVLAAEGAPRAPPVAFPPPICCAKVDSYFRRIVREKRWWPRGAPLAAAQALTTRRPLPSSKTYVAETGGLPRRSRKADGRPRHNSQTVFWKYVKAMGSPASKPDATVGTEATL